MLRSEARGGSLTLAMAARAPQARRRPGRSALLMVQGRACDDDREQGRDARACSTRRGWAAARICALASGLAAVIAAALAALAAWPFVPGRLLGVLALLVVPCLFLWTSVLVVGFS